MIDEPPPIVAPAPKPTPPVPAGPVSATPVSTETVPADVSAFTLPTTTKPDGTLAIDLKPLAPAPADETCVDENPDPFNPTILVCRKTGPDPRLGPVQGPSNEELFASAIPRARVKLSENAEAEANLIKKGVGGADAEGGEVRVKIGF